MTAPRQILDEHRNNLSRSEEPEHILLSPEGKNWDERDLARAFDRVRLTAHRDKHIRLPHFICACHTFVGWAHPGARYSIK